MQNFNKSCSTPTLKDPSTYLQRPTSAKIPDVSHILTTIFGEKYTKDALSADVIKNLTISSDVDDKYHKRYVQKLKEAQLTKENRIQEYAMLEKHILEAKAKAFAYEDRENDKRKRTCEEPDKFGVPTVKSYFCYCLDDALLKEHGLLVPSDYYYKAKKLFVPMPKNEGNHSYLNETISSITRSKKKPILPPINSSRVFSIDDLDDIHKAGSESSSDSDHVFSDNEEDLTNNKPFWKDNMRQEERLIDKENLKNLESRIRFLQNPRFNAARTDLKNQNLENIFECSPKIILFSKYIIGKVYEISFEIRNKSTIAHQFRTVPPKTQYFSLSLGQYPQSQTLIAPGLSALFNVRFAPDSLCTFQDEILVECSNGDKFKIPILAKRESPCLSIGSYLNCGSCLVGQIKGCRFIIKNSGGDGRFVIFPKSYWPASTFKTNLLSTSLNIYPFEIQPSIFELRKGDVFILEVVFKPPDSKKYEQDIVITCDNCTSIEFKLVGEGKLAETEYIGSQDDTGQLNENCICIDDYKDKSSNKIIRFPPLNPNLFLRKQFCIKNNSSCPIDFSWIIYKPVFKDNLLEQAESKNVNYVIEKDAIYGIAPKQGTLDRDEIKTFEILFSPNKTGLFDSVCHMILHGIPEINKQMMLDTSNHIHKTCLNKEDLNTCDFVSQVIELHGECEPFLFTLDPPAIYFPGVLLIQSNSRKAFRLINMSISPISFNWKQIVEHNLIQVEPSYGEIAPKSYALMDIIITGTKPGKLIEDIACFVEFADEPIYLHVEAEIAGPEVIVREAGIDFGLVEIGDSCESYITIENTSNIPLNWHLECIDLILKDHFRYQSRGNLKPLEIKKIPITFRPKEEVILFTQFVINIESGNNITFNCSGQGQRPKANFLESDLVLESLYLGINKLFNVKLCNNSVLESQFHWGELEGLNSSICDLIIEPQNGLVKSKSTLDIVLQIKVNELVKLNDLRIPCYIHNSKKPLYLNISGEVKGASVDFFLDNLNMPLKISDDSNIINFEELKIGLPAKKILYIKNTSGIRTSVNLEILNFKAFRICQKETLYTDPNQKDLKLSEIYKLKNNIQGLGIALEETNFELPEFGTVGFAIIALPEIWGFYEDCLKINIVGIDNQILIPIQANVIDIPIKLYTGKVIENENDHMPMIRFGTQIQGGKSTCRKLQIQNTSFISLEIDWKIYLINNFDKKLIDINMIYQENNLESLDYSQNYSSPTIIQKKTHAFEESKNFIKLNNSEYNEIDGNENISIIKLNITGHYGDEIQEELKIFYLNENKTILKPREKAYLNITFNSNAAKCGEFEAIFVGYINLEKNFKEGIGFKRKTEFEKEPIIFKATGILEAPKLTIEYDNEDLNFFVSSGDLISNNHVFERQIIKKSFSLLNTSLAEIDFELNFKKPFSLSNSDVNRYSLKPKSKMKFEAQFEFDLDFLSKLDISNSKQTIFNDYITINYSKNNVQSIPLTIIINFPEVLVSKKLINFDKVLIGQERHQEFSIRNPSFSSALWNIEIRNDPDSAFSTDIKNGFLEVNKNLINLNEQLINVYFKAKNQKKYNSQILISFKPSFGIEPICIELKAEGSYDQKLDAILNV